MIKVTYDTDMLANIEKKLGAMKQKAPKVLKLAINDTARKARTRLAKKAQETYEVKGTGVNKTVHIQFATASNQEAILIYSGKKIPLYQFKHRSGTLGSGIYYNPTLGRRQIGKGGRGASGKQLKSSSFKSATGAKLKWFIAQMGSGHTGIFQRTGAPRHQGGKGNPEVKEKMGASIPEMIGNEKRVYGVVEPYINSDLETAVERHISRIFKGEI